MKVVVTGNDSNSATKATAGRQPSLGHQISCRRGEQYLADYIEKCKVPRGLRFSEVCLLFPVKELLIKYTNRILIISDLQ